MDTNFAVCYIYTMHWYCKRNGVILYPVMVFGKKVNEQNKKANIKLIFKDANPGLNIYLKTG